MRNKKLLILICDILIHNKINFSFEDGKIIAYNYFELIINQYNKIEITTYSYYRNFILSLDNNKKFFEDKIMRILYNY